MMTATLGHPKVLHIIESLGRGGAEKLLLCLLPQLRSLGVEAEVAVLGREVDLEDELREAGVTVHVLGLKSLRRGFAAIPWLIELIQREKYDLLHTHLPFANLYGRIASRLSGIPATTSYHNTDYEPEALVDNPDLARWKQQLHQGLDFLTASRSPKVVAVSQFVAASVARRLRFHPTQVTVIYNGILSSAFGVRTSAVRRKCRQVLSLPLEARIVVQVGRFSPQKGHLHTVRAAANLRDKEDLIWLMVGDGPNRALVESRIRADGLEHAVNLVGSQKDVKTFLLASDIFVFPSLHEGLGIAALEAMAVGLPVVAYRTGPLPEVVEHRKTGLLVDEADDQALSEAIHFLLAHDQEARKMGEEGRSRVRNHFSVEDTASRHADFYRDLLRSD
jgi:glycosyltransferase involved in cell wall biosynthesis